MADKLGRPVSVQRVSDSDLFSVVFADKVYFTDAGGNVLINGDIVTLSDNVLVSDVIKAEIRLLYEQQLKLKKAKLPSLDSFLTSDYVEPTVLKSPSQPFLHKDNRPQSISKSDRIATKAVTSKDVAPTMELSSDALTKQISRASKQREQLAGERQCLQKMASANSFKELYNIFYHMGKQEKVTCGKAYAASKVPFLKNDSFIVYKAENEQDTITMFSDYTCHICVDNHKNIETLNAQGITVRVAPFGRGEYKNVIMKPNGEYAYGEGYSVLGKNYNALACGTDDPVERKALFSELINNAHKYKYDLLPLAKTAPIGGSCTAHLMRNKLEMDLFTARGTPLYVFSDGSTVRGGMSASEILSHLPSQEL
ncbi:hypothetical protein [Vibrio nigripulchritudo]|nr:hypothetical protein [Vibrio nigripulchritudo]